jgi:hypothetical protein
MSRTFLSAGLSERQVVIRPWRSNEGRRPMFDALLYCSVMADIKHGYFLIVADFLRTITAQFRALWAMTLMAMARPGRKPTARGTLAQTTGRMPAACRQREAWMQSLARLETYVASMA